MKRTTKKTGRKVKPAKDALPETFGTVKIEAPKGLSPKERKAYEEALAKGGGGSAWRGQNPGDCLLGKLLSIERKKMKFGDTTLLTLRDKSGAETVHFCGTVLQRAIEEGNFKAGESVLILYQGRKSTGKGRPAEIYSIAHV